MKPIIIIGARIDTLPTCALRFGSVSFSVSGDRRQDRRRAYTWRIASHLQAHRMTDHIFAPFTWREGKKVRTQSKSLGPVDGKERYNAEFDDWQRQTFGETAAERNSREQQEKLDSLHEQFGLTMPDAEDAKD